LSQEAITAHANFEASHFRAIGVTSKIMTGFKNSGSFAKILVISLAGIGDTLFATPLIHELHQNFPDAEIEALVMWPGSKDLLEGNPFLKVIHQKNLIRASRLESFRFLAKLRQKQFDLSINTHPQSKIHYRAIARLINARLRVSHSYHSAEWLDRILVNHQIPQDYSRHAVENNLSLLSSVGGQMHSNSHHYELFFGQSEIDHATNFLERHHLAGRKWIGIHVGSGGTKNLAARRWPLDNFIELFRRITTACPELHILLFGGPEEQMDFSKIQSVLKSDRILFPETKSIREAAALLKHCQTFLSVDTALMHLAAAMNVPNQFVIETPTWNKVIEPYGNPFTLIKNPSVAGKNLEFYRYDGKNIRGTSEQLKQCMSSVTVEAVESHLRKVI
jgi:heptosyltransferase-2